MHLIFDPLFRIPLIVGLIASILLPLLGALLHAREEWLATLGIAHVTAAAQLVGAALGLPLLASGTIGAIVAVIAKQFTAQQGNLGYALLMFAVFSDSKLSIIRGNNLSDDATVSILKPCCSRACFSFAPSVNAVTDEDCSITHSYFYGRVFKCSWYSGL